ncbi:F-box/kelch-repeat protein At3g23880-like [Apium graveolens]|uniref:F-box/kelch-repeat protein At3g23880-like n=1 Tax=Apium graveolens TaxID=4045 RepID=UPI003D7B14D5
MTEDFQLSIKDLQLVGKEPTSVYHLSDDNLGEIFLRLPVRSLLSCQCVSKRFSEVITNLKFKDIHINRAITSNTTSYCSVFLCGEDDTDESGSNEIVNLRYDHILLENSHRSVSFSYVRLSNPISCRMSIVGSCNGLLCAKLKGPIDQIGSDMLIWNPVTRENRYVADPKINASTIKRTLALAFGFTPKTKDYKVVRVVAYHNSGKALRQPDSVLVIELEVYNMSTDNWRTYEIKTLQCRETDHMPPLVNPNILLGMSRATNTRSLRGAFHWLSNSTADASRNNKSILSFDLEKEQLRLFTVLDSKKIPYVEYGILDCLNDSLSMIVPHYSYKFIDIWVMHDYGDRNSWIKLLTVDQFQGLAAQPIGFWKDKLFITVNKLLCLYNLRNQEMKFFPIAWEFYSATFCDYVETFERVNRATATTGVAVQ